jgi:hypothetical protein
LENFTAQPVIAKDTDQRKEYKTEVELLKLHLENAIKEIEMLKELINSQKKVIQLLEKKKK